MKKLYLLLIAIVFLCISCIDPICRMYVVSVDLKNEDAQFVEYSCILREETLSTPTLIAVILTQENHYNDSYKPWGMGSQIDLRFPEDGVGDLKKMLELIENGGTFIVKAKDKGGNIQSFNLPYTSEDIRDITSETSMYRQYELTLDWNKRLVLENSQ